MSCQGHNGQAEMAMLGGTAALQRRHIGVWELIAQGSGINLTSE